MGVCGICKPYWGLFFVWIDIYFVEDEGVYIEEGCV